MKYTVDCLIDGKCVKSLKFDTYDEADKACAAFVRAESPKHPPMSVSASRGSTDNNVSLRREWRASIARMRAR